MIRKSLPIFLSTLTIGLGSLGALPASAMIIAPGKDAYTTEDLISYSDNIYREIDEVCNMEPACSSNIFWGRRSENPSDTIHSTIDTFYNRQLVVTSVNPSTGTIKFYLQSRDIRRYRYINTSGLAVLQHLHMGWDDPDAGPTFADTDGVIHPISDAHLMPDYFHYIYSADSTTGQLPPTGVEYTIELGNDSLLANTNGYLIYDLATQYLSDHGYADYSSCLNSPYYREGMECRAIYPINADIEYVPYIDGVPAYPPYTYIGPDDSGSNNDSSEANNNNSSETENNTPSESASSSSSDNSSSAREVTASTSSTNSSTTSNSTTTNNSYHNYLARVISRGAVPFAKTIPGKASKDTNDDTSVTEKTKDTSTVDSADPNDNGSNLTEVPLGGGESDNNHATEFPWWIIVLALATGAVVLWLFFPKKSKKA